MSRGKTALFKPINTKRTFENIADQIKELIYSKELKPTDRLPSERELAMQFGTGRMAVREAFRILEESGFVYVKPGVEGGAFVKELDSTGMTKTLSDLIKMGNITHEEITEARISIETTIIEASIQRITKKTLTALEENIRQYEDLLDQKDKNKNQRSMKRPLINNFHILLAEGSKNRLYKYILQSLIDLSNYFIEKSIGHFQLTQDPTHLKHHKAIFAAVKAKNLEQAKKAIQNHLYYVSELIRSEMKIKEK